MTFQISRNLFIKTKLNESRSVEETSTMLLIENALAEARNKNYKKALVEFNQSYLETNENEIIFLSKLLELSLHDLESLFLCLFGCDKNRRLSKQHEKRASSLKKKGSVGDFSFTNAGYDIESIGRIKEQQKTQSLRTVRSHQSLLEEKPQVKNCLRKSFYLLRDLKNCKTQEKCLQSILEVHFKAENYYPCVLLLVDYIDKKFLDKLICSFDDTQKHKIYQDCLFISTNISQNYQQHIVRSTDNNKAVNYCLLAIRIFPDDSRAYDILCRLYRQNKNHEKALTTAKKFLDEINSNSKDLLIQLLLCEIDYRKTSEYILKRLDELITTFYQDNNEFLILKAFMLLYVDTVNEGIALILKMNIAESKTVIKTITEQLNSDFHEAIVIKMQMYFTEQLTNGTDFKLIKEEKTIFLMITQLLAIKTQHQLKFAKLYGDCLVLCGENDIASAYFTQLIKVHENETLPMIHLATLRLKMGAYNAATEDFRTILAMIGADKFSENLNQLKLVELSEIARVHRVHAFRYLSKSMSYKDAADCFSVAICALGIKAVGLLLTRGFCYMHLNDFELAKRDYNSCLSIDSTITSAMFARSVVYAVTTHVEEAIKDFRVAFRTNQNACKQTITKLPLEHVLTFAQLVIQYIKQELERVRAIKTKLYEIQTLNKAHKEESKANGFDVEVLKYSDFLCSSFPKNIDYLCTYIECLHVSKDNTVAVKHVDLYIKLFPATYAFHAWRSVLLASFKRYDEVVNELHNVTEIDNDCQHVFSYLEYPDKKQLAERVYQQALYLSSHDRHADALIYYNEAVLFSNKEPKIIRDRMKCYQKLSETKKWLEDLTEVILLEAEASDLQLRARYFQTTGENFLACQDYITALELNEGETIINVTINSNGDDVVELFYNTAWHMVEIERPKEVLRLCETGLKFDHKHKGLKQLKDRAKSNLTKCVIQ